LTNTDVWIAKLTGFDGSHIWSKSAVGTGSDLCFDLAPVGSDVVLTGNFQGSFNLGTSLTSVGNSDAFITRLSGSNGNHMWSIPTLPYTTRLETRNAFPFGNLRLFELPLSTCQKPKCNCPNKRHDRSWHQGLLLLPSTLAQFPRRRSFQAHRIRRPL